MNEVHRVSYATKMEEEVMGRVETVTGAILPNDLGITLPHEHLLIDMRFFLQEPEEASNKWIVDAPISMENLETFRKSRTISKDNLWLTDKNVAINELNEYKLFGGKSVIETTPIGCGRDPLGLRMISETTGVNVICPTGFYISPTHPNHIKHTSIDDLSSFMISELTEGIGSYKVPEQSHGVNELNLSNILIENLKIKAGFIKMACMYPIKPEEEKVLQAAARAQQETGVHITIHPSGPRFGAKPVEPIVEILRREDANLEKTSICHMGALVFGEPGWTLPLDYHKAVMDEYGVTINFDTFGKNQFYGFPEVYRDDRTRVAAVTELCQQGYDKQIMMSHDVCYKVHLKTYGGYGYAQIVKYVVPQLKFQGVTESQLNNMLIDNPKRILSQ